MSEGNYRLRLKTEADTSGVDEMKSAMDSLKARVEEAQKKINETRDKAQNGGAGTGLKAGVKGADIGSFLGLPSMADAPALMLQAANLGRQIGDALSRGMESTQRGGSFLGGILGEYDPTQDPALQKLMQSYRQIINGLNQKPEAGGIIEWLDEVKRKATEAIDELKHLDDLRKSDEQGQRDATDAAMKDEQQQIRDNPDMSPEQKLEAEADLERRQIEEQQRRAETDRLAQETAALDQIDVKKQELEAAKKAEEELTRRATVGAKAGMGAQSAWEQTDEGKGIGETTSSGLPKMSKAEPMPDAFRRNYIARAGQREGIPDLTDPEAEAKAAQQAREMRIAKEKELEDARREAQQLAERNVSAAANDATSGARQMAAVDQKLEAGKASLPPDPALAQAAQEGSQAMQEGSNDAAQSMRQMSEAMQQGFSTLKSAMAEGLRASQQAQQTAQQALEEARQAKQAAESTRKGGRY